MRPLLSPAVRTIEAWLGQGGPALQEAWRQWWTTRNTSPDAYFGHPLALPVVELPSWAATRIGPALPETPVVAAVASSVAGYIHVRILDDVVDGDRSQPSSPTDLLLSAALLTAHHTFLAVARGASAPDTDASDVWARFARAMCDEAHTRAGPPAIPDEATFQASLDRSRPLGLPAAALFRNAGLSPAPVWEAVDLLIDVHQRHTDLIDLSRDAQHGWTTRVSAQLGIADARATAFQDGTLDSLFRDMFTKLDQAAHAEPELPGIQSWTNARAAALRALQTSLWTRWWAHTLGADWSPSEIV